MEAVVLGIGAVHPHPDRRAVIQAEHTHEAFGVDPLGAVAHQDPERLDGGKGDEVLYILKRTDGYRKLTHIGFSILYKNQILVYNMEKIRDCLQA